MLNQLEKLTERVGGCNELIDRWLHARKQLLVAYYHLVGIKPGKSSAGSFDEKALDNFCHGLVDYLSTCHFRIYERIIREREDIPAINKLWKQLEANTSRIMDYYDNQLENALDHDDRRQLQQALSETGEVLASRFTIEDNIIVLTLNDVQQTEAKDNNTFTKPA